LAQIAAGCVIACSVSARAQDAIEVESVVVVREGPSAAYEFEKGFRDPNNRGDSKPIDLQLCENITKLNADL